jgi:hypothetical protein
VIFTASCEAFGITCGVNSYCDLDQCKCHEGYIHNGTHCTEDPDFGKVKEPPTMRPDEIGENEIYFFVIGPLHEVTNIS